MKIYLVIFFCTLTTLLYTQTIELSFDTLSPKTWYQKRLESLLSGWQALEHYVEIESNNGAFLDYLSRTLVFAQFCKEKMIEERERILDEDYEYMNYVEANIKNLLKIKFFII